MPGIRFNTAEYHTLLKALELYCKLLRTEPHAFPHLTTQERERESSRAMDMYRRAHRSFTKAWERDMGLD